MAYFLSRLCVFKKMNRGEGVPRKVRCPQSEEKRQMVKSLCFDFVALWFCGVPSTQHLKGESRGH